MLRQLFVFTSLVLPLAVLTPSADASVERCRDAIATTSAKLARTSAQAFARCRVRISAGQLPASTDCASEPDTKERLAAAEAALRTRIARACGGGDRICGGGHDDEPLASVGWAGGACPGVLGSSCAIRIDDCGDLAECVVCSARVATSEALTFAGDRFDVPASKGTAKCQQTIAKATAQYFAGRTNALASCGRVKGGDAKPVCMPPDDERTQTALARAESQLVRSICRACGGKDKRCDGTVATAVGSGAADDPSPQTIALQPTCPDVTAPGSAKSCASEVGSLSDAVACLECTTRYRADCAALATTMPTQPLPKECTRAALCDPGYTGVACDELLPEVVTELAALPDPQRWTTDGDTSHRYRRATRRERRRYGWLPGTYLVEAPDLRGDLTDGKTVIELVLPAGEGKPHHVVLDLASAERGAQMIEVRADAGVARAKAAFPMFFNYLSRTKPETSFEEIIHVLAVEDGGAKLSGMAGTRRVDGYVPTGTLELDPQLTTPNGPNPAQLFVVGVFQADTGTAAGWNECHGEGICDAFCHNQGITAPCSADAYNPCCEPYDPDGQPGDDCHDGFDNDGDGKIDQSGSPADSNCAHSQYCVPNGHFPPHTHPREAGKQFILLGEIHLCSWFADQLKDWRAELHTRATHIVGGFEAETGYEPWHELTANRMGLRFTTAKCWILDDLEQARDCKDGSLADCDPFDAAPHVYPYAGAGNNSSNYLFDNPRADMEHAVDIGLWQPVNLVQVLMATGTGQALTGATSPAVAGRAEGAYSVVKWTDTFASENFNVSNHELGHSFGFTHCDSEISPIDGACTIMGDDHNTGGGNCLLSDICNVPDGHARLSAANAQSLYATVRDGSDLPYHFGNAP